MRNLPLTFDHSSYSQKYGEGFPKLCGLLRIYELYQTRVEGRYRTEVQNGSFFWWRFTKSLLKNQARGLYKIRFATQKKFITRT